MVEALSVREESRVNVHDNRGNDSMKEKGSEREGEGRRRVIAQKKSLRRSFGTAAHRSGTEWAALVDCESQLDFPFSGDLCKNVL